MKKLISVIVSVAMIMAMYIPISHANGEDVKVIVNGAEIEFDVPPMIENDRVLVPMRAIFEELGAYVSWYGETWKGTQMVSARKTVDRISTNVDLTIGASEMKKEIAQVYGDGMKVLSEETIPLDSPAIIVGGRTLVPLRAVSEVFGADVQWYGDARTVTITSAVEPELTPGLIVDDYHLRIDSFADRLNDHMPDDKNYMFSPLSVKMALAMAANGAKGDTKSEILDTLGIDDLDEFNEKAKHMIETYDDNDVIKLRIANSLWRNTDRDIMTSGFSDSYKKTIAEYYKGEATDVINENTVEKVNDWVNEKTNGKIPTIIDKPGFDAMLINAVYFKAAWEHKFYEIATAPDTFTSRDGSQTQIDFMHTNAWLDYSNVRGVKMLRLPYKNRISSYDENGIISSDSINVNVSMYIILSDNVNPEYEIECADFDHSYVSVSLPKFKIEFATGLNEILQSMGMELAFELGKADFTNMTSVGNYFIDKTIHKTYIDVDEKGTEAAAVTAVAAGGSSGVPSESIEFKADKPFTFVIYDHTNEEVMFMGEYAYAE